MDHHRPARFRILPLCLLAVVPACSPKVQTRVDTGPIRARTFAFVARDTAAPRSKDTVEYVLDAMQEAINQVRNALQSVPMIPALKRVIAHYSGDMGWNRLRPPLTELTAAEEKRLLSRLEELEFGMPGIREAALA